mmetsp:Transcript_24400/g.55282  ORF Transcript_24400/g.55282 Transcript_24400/m.55282 type:complete len:105 (+) Transcript_24400:108-422(+)
MGLFFLSALLHTWNDHFYGQNCFVSKMIAKECISGDTRWMALFLGFRSVMPMSSDLSYGVASRRYRSRKSVGSSGRHTYHEVDSRRESRQSSAFRRPPEAAGGS